MFQLPGCTTLPVNHAVEKTLTVRNSDPSDIIWAAQSVFSTHGCRFLGTNYPEWISFEKTPGEFSSLGPAGVGKARAVRVLLTLARVPGNKDCRIIPHVYSVSDTDDATYEIRGSGKPPWSSEFTLILREVAA